jgi:flavin-dependent dehydrogenase
MKHFDVVIIGGSLAGAACASGLQRRGIDAVALERDTFPRSKVCGGFLSPGAIECLDELGVLSAVDDAGAKPVDHAWIRTGAGETRIPFEETGLGISRYALDAILARSSFVETRCNVQSVQAQGDEFVVHSDHGTLKCKVIIDAAGKLSRWARRSAAPEFGVQFMQRGTRGSALDFWFFEDGYGGAVSVEREESNFCFLIDKKELPRYVRKPGCLVTGPLAYERQSGEYIAIGDALGMIDPFCGEGMHHALDSARITARAVADGLRKGISYGEVRDRILREYRKRWAEKRMLASMIRHARHHPSIFRLGSHFAAARFLRRLWRRDAFC